MAVAELVATLLNRGHLDPEQQTFIDSLFHDEAFKARVEELRKYTAADLDRS